MPDSRKARRIVDPGLQPERTSIAWFRTLLGYGALLALALRHSWYLAGMLFWISLGILALTATMLWYYTRRRSLMDVAHDDFMKNKAIGDKLSISLAVLFLSLLFAMTHIYRLIELIGRLA